MACVAAAGRLQPLVSASLPRDRLDRLTDDVDHGPRSSDDGRMIDRMRLEVRLHALSHEALRFGIAVVDRNGA